MKTVQLGHPFSLLMSLLTIVVASPANSQPITPANDGTGTTVTPQGNQFNIEGGTRSGANLFHSFDQFNVPINQTANFLTTPDTSNILGRVTGGNASYINGLIQVIGGNSNLFLINPAGIMFGPNASLNIPASFSVTTATGIGFDNNNFWFKAMGTNDYSNLVGNPSGYRFNVSNPGAIVNEGNLTLNPGENLTLLGGTVINTGQLSTAGGNITIAAVEGGSVLRISQPGHLLSLEVGTLDATSLENGENIFSITPLSLATLLTGGEIAQATSVIVNENGQIVLTDSNTLVADTPGTAITSGPIDVSTPPNPPYEGGDINSLPLFKGDRRGIGGQVNVLGDRVALINTNINADGLNGGGTVLIGGDFQGNGIVPNSRQTFVNQNSIISADATTKGDGGQVIIWSDGITNFGGNISAKGGEVSGDGGLVEVSGKQELIFNGNVDVSAALGNSGTILLDPENVTVGEENSETLGDNSEVSATENSDSETETVENNSEVLSTENTDSQTTEIADNSETETVENNSEVLSTENTDSQTTEIADNSETTETETPIDPFAQDENADVTISAENLGELSGDVILQADNDITINEKIETDSSVELKAGRSININADIDTSVGNGNIDLFGNNDEMNFVNRSDGKASINQLDGTTLNAGSGRINIQLGNLGEVGDINLANLTTTGQVLVNANGGNIVRVSENSLINAGSVLFQTNASGGIGLTDAPLRLNVENLEAVSGSGGVFFDVGNVNVGGVNEDVNGISTGAGGDIRLDSIGDVTVTEDISAHVVTDGETGGDININAKNLSFIYGGSISVLTFAKGDTGSVEIHAADTVVFDGGNSGSLTGIHSSVELGAEGNAGGVTITTGSLELKNGATILTGTSGKGDAGSVKIDAADTVVFDRGDSEIPTGVISSVIPGAKGYAGDVTITTRSLFVKNGAQISASTLGNGDAGSIFITTETQLTLNENAQISAFTESTGDGGNIILLAPETLNIEGNGKITTRTSGEGKTGQIDILSPNITLSDGIDITAFTESTGKAGNINLEGNQINIQPNTQILAFTESTGDGGNITVRATETLNLQADTQLSVETNRSGKAGDIEITTPKLTIGENAQITATVNIGATTTEAGGNITINTNQLDIAGELGIFAETEATADAVILTLTPYKTNPNLDINFTNQGFISASTSSTGNGGNINISAPESINIKGDGNISVQTTDKGNAGAINIDTQNLTLSDGVAISASTEDKGNAGAIKINTRDLTLETGTSLTTETNDAGKAGDIEINTRQLTIGEDAQISATAKKGATNTEAGGNITINANDLFISGRLGIFAETAGETPAGTLTLNPYRNNPNLNITFTENGFISARTTASGDGGNINIFAPENINISGEGRITVETEGAGNAGIINIETENLTIAENTTISAATSDTGDGGSINITPSQTFQLEGQIITETTGEGNGGTISINTGEMTAPNSTISAKSTNAGNAGEINIQAENNITTGIITSEANNTTETADGGNITITSEQGEINATQAIQSFSDQGNAGDVTLTAKNNITTNTISSHGQQQGGQITIKSETGNIDTSNSEFLANYSGGGDGGNVTIEAPQGDITTNDIYSFADADGGQITLKAGGDINITPDSNIISASEPPEKEGERGRWGDGEMGRGKGGDIILEAGNNINTRTARIFSGADIGDTGKIDIIALFAIEAGQIDLASGFVRQERPVNNNFTLIPVPQGEATQGIAGNITLRSNNSTIDTTAGTINSRSPDGTGNITLNARENITTGKLEASALNESQPTRGGDVEIISQQGEINATQEIETFSQQGTAGNVNIIAEGSVNIENILSQGTQRGGDITIDSRSENSINVQGALNTFSTTGIAGDVNLTSPGNITISGIRSEGMEQGGEIRVESEIGEITSTENIDSFSDQGIGGDVKLNASESVNLANVSSFGATESGDLIIQIRTATVNTGNVTTQAPSGSSGSIIINGTEVGTGDLNSIRTTSAGEINVEATDGSITTYHIEISSDGTIGDLILKSGENPTTGDINQTPENDTNVNPTPPADINTPVINQTPENDTNVNQTPQGDINTPVINQTPENDTNVNQTPQGDINTPVINQTPENDTNVNQTPPADINTPVINQTPENDTTTIQNPQTNQNIDIPSINSNNNNNNSNSIINPIINQNNPQNNQTNTLNNPTNNTTTNFGETNTFSTTTTSEIISTATPSNNNQTKNTATAKEKTESSINNTTDTQEILNRIDTVNTNPLTVATGSDQIVTMLEQNRNKEYSDYFGEDLSEKLVNTKNVRDILTDMAAKTGKESAVVYINAYSDQIQIILFTKDGQPILKTIPTVNQKKLLQNAIIFSGEITDFRSHHTTSYLPLAQKLYNWLISPIAAELEAANIDTILFSMDDGFRLLPMAALHDGEQFLIEKYSISLIPSVSLIDSRYNSVQNTKLLGMGASQFTNKPSLPAVTIELQTISEKLWRGNIFLNEEFTKNNLINELENRLYPIVHLATHAEFRAGNANDSYIQLWDDKLGLDELRKLRWNSDKAELLVLSACRTAVGDRNAELGFAGLAIATGVKSALGSFWFVSDEGTLGLMTEFYAHLSNVKIKAEALREAQLAMLRGEVVIADGTLRGSGSRGEVSLPPELANIQNKNFAHPYYWAGFTMVGSPW